MSRLEKLRFRASFPSLDVDRAVVTGGVSTVYNCIAWTVGITTRWIWPGNSLVDFDTFYAGLGFVPATDGIVAAWGLSAASMKHGSVSGPRHGPRWESKCGTDLRIQHGLDELTGSSYGRVIVFYRESNSVSTSFSDAREDVMNAPTAKSYMKASQRRALGDQIDRLPKPMRKSFAKAFNAWKDSWFRGGVAMSSDPQTRTVGKEYDALIAMGPTILPLVVEALADPENFFALGLYDALQSDEKLIVQFEPDDERILEGEQGRARRVVQAWFANS